MKSNQLPRVRVVGLLVITFFVALAALLVQYTGALSIPVTYVFAPTIVAGVFSQIEWSRQWRPLPVFRGTLFVVWAISLFFPLSILLLLGPGPAFTVFFCHTALTAFFWLPQYFIVVSTYEQGAGRRDIYC